MKFTVVLPSLLYFTEYKLQGVVTVTLIEGKAYYFISCYPSLYVATKVFQWYLNVPFVHIDIMCSVLVKFLSFAIICVIFGEGLCQEEWRRQSDGSASTNEFPTSEYICEVI